MLLAVSAATFALGFAEAALRLVAPQETLFPRYVTSDRYAIELPVSAEIHHRRGRLWSFVYTTNRIGRRGPFVTPESDASTMNVVVLGDSFSFGIGVNDGEEFASRLASALGNDYAVINGGMSGWSIDSQAKWFHEVGSAYQPRFVVLQFTANDPAESRSGVASLEAGEFSFMPYTGTKPLWQQWVSASRILQHSHVFSLLRGIPSAPPRRARVPRADGSSDARSSTAEGRYARYLRAFARDMADQDRVLLLVSVTHRSDGRYAYDVERFPVIAEAVEELSEAGLLTFVELPLQEMSRHAGSPEGHQWGAVHHRIVGERIAEEVLRTGVEG